MKFPIELKDKYEFGMCEWSLFCTLFILIYRKNRNTLNLQALADFAGISDMTVKRDIKKLIAKKLLSRARRNASHPYSYTLHI